MKVNVVAIIQGRMSSSRLPGKILLDIGGRPMLTRVLLRARRAQLVDQVVVATTTDPSDDPVAEFCKKRGYPCYRGNLFDVLDRYYQAAKLFKADVIVRLTADCPVIDPGEIDRTIKAFFDSGADFAANRLPPPFTRTTPIGLDTEVCSFNALKRAWNEAEAKFEREHVMPYLYDEPGRFKIVLVDHDPDYGHFRWTVDTPADLALLREIYASFNNSDDFTLEDLLEKSEKHPEWQAINANIRHNTFKDTDARVKDG